MDPSQFPVYAYGRLRQPTWARVVDRFARTSPTLPSPTPTNVSCVCSISFSSGCLCPDLALAYAESMVTLPSPCLHLCSRPVHLIARRPSSHRSSLSAIFARTSPISAVTYSSLPSPCPRSPLGRRLFQPLVATSSTSKF
jgi:hypothetical protein